MRPISAAPLPRTFRAAATAAPSPDRARTTPRAAQRLAGLRNIHQRRRQRRRDAGTDDQRRGEPEQRGAADRSPVATLVASLAVQGLRQLQLIEARTSTARAPQTTRSCSVTASGVCRAACRFPPNQAAKIPEHAIGARHRQHVGGRQGKSSRERQPARRPGQHARQNGKHRKYAWREREQQSETEKRQKSGDIGRHPGRMHSAPLSGAAPAASKCRMARQSRRKTGSAGAPLFRSHRSPQAWQDRSPWSTGG